MRNVPLILGLGLGLATSTIACTHKEGTGAGVGAVAGGAIGGAVGGTTGLIIGAAAGGALGYTVGHAMEEEDRRRAAYALENNRPVAWHNDRTGNDYRIEPGNSSMRGGRECREFRMMADVDGRPDEVRGLACRTPQGGWETI